MVRMVAWYLFFIHEGESVEYVFTKLIVVKKIHAIDRRKCHLIES